MWTYSSFTLQSFTYLHNIIRLILSDLTQFPAESPQNLSLCVQLLECPFNSQPNLHIKYDVQNPKPRSDLLSFPYYFSSAADLIVASDHLIDDSACAEVKC